MSSDILLFFRIADNIFMEDEIAKYNLRLPEDLYERIVKKAKESRRSTNGQMIVMFEDWFINHGEPMSSDELLRILKERLDEIELEKKRQDAIRKLEKARAQLEKLRKQYADFKKRHPEIRIEFLEEDAAAE
jgi:hypothetical protein